MKLPGRIAAAIEVLADIGTRHRPVSEALRDWGQAHRFAGSGDRAAIGNLVYDALRRRSSIAWRMQGDTPWHLAVGATLAAFDMEAEALNAAFAGDPHAPAPVPPGIPLADVSLAEAPPHVRADMPEWLAPQLEAGLGPDWIAEGEALARRPPLDLRVNTLKSDRDKVARNLARHDAQPTPLSPVGLRIAPALGDRRHPNVQVEEAFQRGRVEIQDEGSQLCALLVGAEPGEQVLDFCAGAGGKTLALSAAMDNRGQIFAWDADRNRLAPIFERLKRAGARNVQVRPPGEPPEDLAGRMDRVLVDAPCTGTGVWRRRPDAKWRLTSESLDRRIEEQDAVLGAAARFVRPGGVLAYATCSLLPVENAERVAAFLAERPDFAPLSLAESWTAMRPGTAAPVQPDGSLVLSPHRTGTDGFFLALLRRDPG